MISHYINLNKIKAICFYINKKYPYYEKLERKGTEHWHKLFGIKLYKSIVEEDTIYPISIFGENPCSLDEYFKEHDFLTLSKNGDNILYKPHVGIFLDGDDATSYNDMSHRKFFNSEEELREFAKSLASECESHGIFIKEI
jgi:hypothetical protein